MKLKYITLTGADEKTNISDLVDISKEFPFVEWAFLFSHNSGKPRYPSYGWMLEAISELKDTNLAIHLCGSACSEVLHEALILKIFVKNIQ